MTRTLKQLNDPTVGMFTQVEDHQDELENLQRVVSSFWESWNEAQMETLRLIQCSREQNVSSAYGHGNIL